MKAKDNKLPKQVITQDEGATIEEIDDEEAKKIELREMLAKQQAAKNAPKKEKKEGDDAEDEKEDKNL